MIYISVIKLIYIFLWLYIFNIRSEVRAAIIIIFTFSLIAIVAINDMRHQKTRTTLILTRSYIFHMFYNSFFVSEKEKSKFV